MDSTKQVQPGERRKPPAAGKGRKKGSVNKVSADLKNMILQALSNSGGADYLERRANDPKTAAAFLGLVGKVLPLTLAGDSENPARIVFEWKREQ